ncbi:MAG: hypothetical protein PHQ35_11615 [Phycisphaerae bacterium]|nr:hypothetical protein [Phycisphaerae bacterium]
MEIEIRTTKKKLSFSLISQMRDATEYDLKEGIVLGFVLKNGEKTMLIKVNNNYAKIQMLDWRKWNDKHICAPLGMLKGEAVKRISDGDVSSWVSAYNFAASKIQVTDQIYL